jgi:Polyketide cyclase / dehydrase and lipid transport
MFYVKKINSRYSFRLLLIIFFLSGFTSLGHTENDTDVRLKEGEIIACSEDVEGTPIKKGTVTGVINVPPETVWQVITDNNNFKKFMPQTLDSLIVTKEQVAKILKKNPKKRSQIERLLNNTVSHPLPYQSPGKKWVVYFYSLLDFPWPISNRWYIIKINRDETRASENIYFDSWDLEIGNLKMNQGFWLLEPFGQGGTKTTYQLLIDPGGHIPKFFIDIGTKVTMPGVIRAVREQAYKIYKKEKK